MSFFKKITKEFENFGIGDRNADQPPPPQQQQYGGGYPDQGHGQGPRDYAYQAPGLGGPPPAQYQAQPPPPIYQQPPDKPLLPQGWAPHFDQQHQRWYYVELATGRTQWEAPGQPPPPPMGTYPSDGSRGYGDSGHGGAPGYGAPGPYGGHSGYGGNSGSYGGGYDSRDGHGEKSSSSKGMLLGAAGGLAVGAVGGALVADALDDSDEEHRSAPPPAEYSGYGGGSSYETGPPGVLPTEDANGDSVSSSDREDVQEAREEYEEAAAEAVDSDASSSDREEAEEAREEYEEEYEEVYED